MQGPTAQPFNLYFLSMCCSRLLDGEQAREYFDRAEALVQRFQSELSHAWRTELTQLAEEARPLLVDPG